MKVLWIVNKIFPYPAKMLRIKENVFGGWLEGLADSLKHVSNLNLAIATVYSGNKILLFEDNKIKYYLDRLFYYQDNIDKIERKWAQFLLK